MYTRRPTEFHLVHIAVAAICFFITVSHASPISTQEKPGVCLVSNLLVAQSMGSGVRVSHKNSLPDSIQQSVTLPDDRLPSTCGPHFSRCNMILINNSAMPHSVLVVPVQRGVALIQILYDVINETLQLGSYHILELSSAQIGATMCQITTLYDFTMRNAPDVIGLCLNEVNIRRISITIDFNNLPRSFLSRYAYDIPITLHSQHNLSNFVSITSNLPLCWEGLLNSLAYYFDRSSFGLFDLITEGSDLEEYTLYYGNGDVFVCSLPHQLVRVSEQNLIMYCENVTAEIDMCEFSGSSVHNVKFYNESNGGVPYYCSPDMSSYVMVSGKTVTFNSTINHTIPLMSNESIYSGNCIRSGDGILLAVTTTTSSIYLLDLQKEESDGVLLKVRNQPIFAHHHVYNESILYTNGSSTILYNTSCQNDPHRIIIEHPYQLALHMFGEGIQPCSCLRPVIQDSTTEPVPASEPSDNKVLTIVVSVTLVTALIAVLVIFFIVVGVLIYRYCKRSAEKLRRRPLVPSKKMDNKNRTNKEAEVSTSFIDPISPKDIKGQGSPGSEGEGEGESRQKKAGKAATAEDASTQFNSSSSGQSDSATVDCIKLDLAQHEQVQSDSGAGTGTGTCCQENSWKNSEKKSVVIASSRKNPYPGITISQPGASGTNERAASEENLTRSPCNESDMSDGERTSSFNSSLGNSGNHPNPTTTPVECSDNTTNS